MSKVGGGGGGGSAFMKWGVIETFILNRQFNTFHDNLQFWEGAQPPLIKKWGLKPPLAPPRFSVSDSVQCIEVQ